MFPRFATPCDTYNAEIHPSHSTLYYDTGTQIRGGRFYIYASTFPGSTVFAVEIIFKPEILENIYINRDPTTVPVRYELLLN
jgi:hypothetical protein